MTWPWSSKSGAWRAGTARPVFVHVHGGTAGSELTLATGSTARTAEVTVDGEDVRSVCVAGAEVVVTGAGLAPQPHTSEQTSTDDAFTVMALTGA